MQARDAIATPPINGVDIIPLDNRPGIRLHQHELNKGVHVREEVGIQAAVGVQARDIGARHAIHGGELSPDQNFAARIISHAVYIIVSAGHAVLKAAVEAAIRIQTCDAMASLPIDGIKVPSNQYLPVRLNREGVNVAICNREKVGVQAAVRAEARDVIASLAIHAAERAPDQHSPVQ